MGRKRKELSAKLEGSKHVVYFNHPVRKQTLRMDLGGDAVFRDNLAWLNRVFLDEKLWDNPPENMPPDLRRKWLGHSVTLSNKGVKVRGEKDDELTFEGKTKDEVIEELQNKLAESKAEAEALKDERKELHRLLNEREKELEHWKGSKIRKGPAPTLAEAKEAYLKHYTGSEGQKQHVKSFLKKFITAHGETTSVDEFAGKEKEINSWLHNLPISPRTRHAIRIYVINMLEQGGGIHINRKLIEAPTVKEIREARGAIKWLEKAQAQKVANKLTGYWRDLFRVQVATGLRADEIITLRRECFEKDYSKLTLQPYEHLTLKTHSRTIQVPEQIRPILKRRLKETDFLFPRPETNEPWKDRGEYHKRYNEALNAVREECNIPFKLDCRTGRRTCGSILIRSGQTVEHVAALLGNSPEIVREHYARILPTEVDSKAAALK